MKNLDSWDSPQVINLEALGASLREVSNEIMQTEGQEVKSLWFHSELGADLYVWGDVNGNIIKQQLSFLGQVVEWNIVEGLRTGISVEDDQKPPVKNNSPMVFFDDELQKGAVHQAIEVIRCLQVIDEDEKKRLITNFQNPDRWQKVSAIEFLKKFGNPSVAPKRSWMRWLGSEILYWLRRWWR